MQSAIAKHKVNGEKLLKARVGQIKFLAQRTRDENFTDRLTKCIFKRQYQYNQLCKNAESKRLKPSKLPTRKIAYKSKNQVSSQRQSESTQQRKNKFKDRFQSHSVSSSKRKSNHHNQHQYKKQIKPRRQFQSTSNRNNYRKMYDRFVSRCKYRKAAHLKWGEGEIRYAYTLHKVNNKSFEDIAKELQRSPQAVRTKIYFIKRFFDENHDYIDPANPYDFEESYLWITNEQFRRERENHQKERREIYANN